MSLKANLIGSLSVLLWGMSTAISLLVSMQIGALTYFISLFITCGLLGFIISLRRKEKLLAPQVLRNKYFYLRGVFFIIHESLSITSIYIVSKANVPVIILINYLWPTAIIFCSILLAGVKVCNWKAFAFGTLMVLGSLTYEVVGSELAAIDLFARPTDMLAYALTFIGAISWGLYCALTRAHNAESGGAAAVKYFQLAFAGLAPLLLCFPPLPTEYLLFTATLFAICVIINFVGYLCWDYGIHHGNIVILSLTADFIPWISLTGTSMIHNITIHSHTIISVILLVFGAIITRSGTLQKKFSL